MEHSNALRQCVDAYVTNIDGFGHRFEPAIDLEAEDAEQRIRDSLILEQMAEQDDISTETLEEPTQEEIGTRKAQLQRLARFEKAKLESFFESSCYEHSFVDLRRRSRQDLEITGNAYWEVLRDSSGKIARLVYVPAYTVRLMPLDKTATEITERRRISPVTYQKTTIRQRLRRYIQIQGTEKVFFRSFGDPRILSKKDGRVFPNMESFQEANPDDEPATELLHFAIHSPRSPYGIPRWVGTLLSILGSRQMEEVNYLYFDNKSVPPLAVLVSGGKLSDQTVPRIESFIEENIHGKTNFHKVLILEAEGRGSNDPNRTKIELQPLSHAQLQDALFQKYDERNIDKVGASFRLPRLLRGESTDYNRSVADAQLRFAEDQVFQPERDEFDFLMNHRLLADMNIRFWRFQSQTTVIRDPERMTNMVEKLVRVGVLIPEEEQMLAEDIFNREFRKISDVWVKRPITLTLAAIQGGDSALYQPSDDAEKSGSSDQTENRLIERQLEMATKSLDELEVEYFKVPDEEFYSWLEQKP